MIRIGVAAYPWDFAAKEVEAILDRLNGEWGIHRLAVVVGVPHSTRYVTREDALGVETTSGGFAFHPREELYDATRLRPVRARETREAASLERLLEACATRQTDVKLILSASLTGRMALTYPEAAAKSFLGHGSSASLCLLHPDVRAFLLAIVEDLSTRERVNELELEALLSRCNEFWSADQERRSVFDPALTSLASMCGCESCRQSAASAGLDVERLAAKVAEEVRRRLRGERTKGTRTDVALQDPDVQAYVAHRAGAIASLVDSLARRCATPMLIHQTRDVDERGQHALLEGSLISGWVHDVGTAPLPPRTDAGSRATLRINPIQRWGLLDDPTRLVAEFAYIADAGYAGLDLHTLGGIPSGYGDALRQGTRIVRRSTSGA